MLKSYFNTDTGELVAVTRSAAYAFRRAMNKGVQRLRYVDTEGTTGDCTDCYRRQFRGLGTATTSTRLQLNS